MYLPECENESDRFFHLSKMWEQRAQETYFNTFWQNINNQDVEEAKSIANKKKIEELNMLKKVLHNDGEYLLTIKKMKKLFVDAGFTEVFGEGINSYGEHIHVFKK